MSATLDTITLPDEAIWLNEASWSAVAQSTSYTLSGSLVVEQGVKLAGRPMRLGGDNCWARWSLVKQLLETTHEADKEMTLTLEDGRRFTVIWNHDDGDPVEVTRLYERQPRDNDWCRLTMKFLITADSSQAGGG